MLDTKQFLKAIDELEANGIARDVTIQALKEAFESIFKKKNYEDTRVEVEIKPEEGRIDIFDIKTVVEEVEDDNLEISLEEAQQIDPSVKVGEDFKTRHEVNDFTKADALKFKSILRQKIKEAEKAAIYAAYSDKEGELITGVVEKIEPRYTLVNIGRTSVILPDNQKIGEEQFTIGQTIKVYLSHVNSLTSGPQIRLSRSDAGFLKRLFEEEIPEIYDGTVVIKDVAREAGERSKVSVYSTDPNVDPIGACIGQGGSKIQKICSQLGKEKIDIVQYHEYPGLFIAEALKPASVISVRIDELAKSAVAVVKNDELRVAIGKRGINAILAVKLTGWKIDIKEQDVAITEGIVGETLEQMQRKEDNLILEKRREELLKANEVEQTVPESVEEVPSVDETVTDEVVTTKEVETKEEPVVEEVTPNVDEVVAAPKVEEEKVEPEVEEKVEYKPVNMQPKVSLADLEQQIEDEKKKKSQPQRKKFVKKDEESTEEVETKEETKNDPKNYMSIYTDEELEELDTEDSEDQDKEYDDDDVDYSEYDSYYEDN